MTTPVLQFSVTYGIRPGYGGTGRLPSDPLGHVAGRWQSAMLAEGVASGILVTAVVSPARVVYARDHGCPPLGEIAVTVSGASNPAHHRCTDLEYAAAVRRVAEATRVLLRQTTARLLFTAVVMDDYLRDSPGDQS